MLNRTRLELKLYYTRVVAFQYYPLNRTRLELKLLMSCVAKVLLSPLNRTRLELKLNCPCPKLANRPGLIAPDWN